MTIDLARIEPPRVAEHDGRVYIVIDKDWYQFPEGTTREHALSVLSEATAIAAAGRLKP